MSGSRVEILIDRRATRLWHRRLRDRLAALLPESAVRIRLADGADAFPSSIETLLTLERLLKPGCAPRLSDHWSPADSQEDASFQPWIRIDCTGRVAPAAGADGVRVIRPLYDGQPGELAGAAALLAGSSPEISLQDVSSGAILSNGLPSLEAADGLTGGLEAVASRVITLVERALASPPQALGFALAPQTPPRARGAAAFFLRNLAHNCARRLYHLSCYSPHWRVGWRWSDGPGALETGSLAGAPWRPLPDLGAAFSADPFPIRWQARTFVFFERLDHRVGKGVIFAQEFGDAGPIGPPIPALEEPWHLSYPFLIALEGAIYMMPEASASGAVTLYRCVEFPRRWEPAAQLLTGVEAADATIFRRDGRYWMTSAVRDGVGGYSDTLAIHYADDVFGPWREHAQRPALINARYARPAGNVAELGGALLRPVQDCSHGYGKKIAIARIDRLDPENFTQSIVGTLSPGAYWPGGRLHTLNRSGRLECIDGAILTPKNAVLRRVAHAYQDRGLHPTDAAPQ
jgi:hypothetical protein